MRRVRNLLLGQREAAADSEALPDMVDEDFRPLRDLAAPYTMTSTERLYALHQAIKYIIRHRVPGAFVECGVWKGGSSMLAAAGLLAANDCRPLYLYDTFEGMPPPSALDVSITGQHAQALLDGGSVHTQAVAPLKEVKANFGRIGYPADLVMYVEGKVEDTIPSVAPEEIAVLRLDTDWYESTKHELEHLYPRLVSGGVLIIDDYGWWEGARRAVDEFFADRKILLHRIDVTGRIGVKP
jgi:hypothetical protein